MIRRLAAIAMVATVLAAAGCGSSKSSGGSAKTGTITVSGAWARSTAATATSGAIYMTITNKGSADDALSSVDVPSSVAGSAGLHQTSTGSSMGSNSTTMGGGGMSSMQEVTSIPVAAGKSVALAPGGYHVMLMELAKPLQTGQHLAVTLHFRRAGALTVEADVRDTAP